MALALVGEGARAPDPFAEAHARLRLFLADFAAALPGLMAGGGEARVDRRALAQAWLAWRVEAAAHPPHAAPGVLFACLLRQAPVRVVRMSADGAHPWAEGRVLAAWCLDYRRALLGVDDPPGAVLDDAPAWAAFRVGFVADPATDTAIAFLDRCAGEAHGAPAAAGPRVVRDRPLLPEGARVAIFELAVLTNTTALRVAALALTLRRYGAPLPEAEVRRRFLHQPPARIATHVALATGLVCPGTLNDDLNEAWAALMSRDVRPAPGAEALVAALAARGMAVRIVVTGALDEGARVAVSALFPGILLDLDMPAGPGAVVIAEAPDLVAAAHEAGLFVLGVAENAVGREALRRAGAIETAEDCAAILASLDAPAGRPEGRPL